MGGVVAVVEAAIDVDDLDAAEVSYRGVLGLEVMSGRRGGTSFEVTLESPDEIVHQRLKINRCSETNIGFTYRLAEQCRCFMGGNKMPYPG